MVRSEPILSGNEMLFVGRRTGLSVVTLRFRISVGPPSQSDTVKSTSTDVSSLTVTALVSKSSVGGFCAQTEGTMDSTRPAMKSNAGSPPNHRRTCEA